MSFFIFLFVNDDESFFILFCQKVFSIAVSCPSLSSPLCRLSKHPRSDKGHAVSATASGTLRDCRKRWDVEDHRLRRGRVRPGGADGRVRRRGGGRGRKGGLVVVAVLFSFSFERRLLLSGSVGARPLEAVVEGRGRVAEAGGEGEAAVGEVGALRDDRGRRKGGDNEDDRTANVTVTVSMSIRLIANDKERERRGAVQ